MKRATINGSKQPRHQAEFAELEKALPFDPVDLETPLVEQPSLFYAVARGLAMAQSQRDAVKNYHAEVEAQTRLGVNPDVKITVAQMDALVRIDPAVVGAAEQLRLANETVNEFIALRDAYLQRSYALKELVVLQQLSRQPMDIASVREQRREYYQDLQRKHSGDQT